MKYHNHEKFIDDYNKSDLDVSIDYLLEWIAALSENVRVGENFHAHGYSNDENCEEIMHTFTFEKRIIDNEKKLVYLGTSSKKV
ncbi:hypothetical protein [Listeria ivanovii]|uniref:hypothetical protein n=1 Tax=Listeria ivanovii TaxID=1638 RepID=UPI00194104AD|nr:hypothetical protein [Listeria ivanovii]MBM5607447.1 hypothetical protein [Listeria ivanovii]MBM5707647.1 hypothetical protein [Listeria ivanovii]